MSTRDYFEEGVIRDLMQRGLITPTVFRQFEIAATVKFYQTQGHNKTQAVRITSDECRACERTVWTAVRIMEE